MTDNPEARNPAQSEDPEPIGAEFIVRVVLSVAVLAAGFGFLLFGSGDASDTGLAAGGVGLIFGHWMR